MRCKSCDYRLWNITSRRCPECGAAFVPSDFEFVPNAVRFCCPHCEQDYYGVGAYGHLEPVAFDCAKCAKHIHMDEMVLLPTEGLHEDLTRVSVCPWLERPKRGRFSALFATIGMAMVSPGRLMRSLPGDVRAGQAWLFMVATCLPAWMIGTGLLMLFVVAGPLWFGGGKSGAAASVPAVVGSALLRIAVITLVTVLVLALLMILWSAVTHGILRLSGDIKGPMARTTQALCYASGAGVLTAIPCMGMYIGWIWPIISGVLMVKEAQEVRGWRAALAVITFPVGSIFLFIAAYAVLIASVMSGAFGGGFTSGFQETQVVSAAVSSYAHEHNGTGPGHSIELAQGGYLEVDDFVTLQSASTIDLVPVGDTNLEAFDLLGGAAKQRYVDEASDDLPDNVVAHRLGDYVFTYHGIDVRNADPNLWLVIASPDPDQNAAANSGSVMCVGMAGGTTQPFPPVSMTQMLTIQNQLRATHSLPPLPDPSTVTHDQPATASPDQ